MIDIGNTKSIFRFTQLPFPKNNETGDFESQLEL
jgi:hypothetical protein